MQETDNIIRKVLLPLQWSPQDLVYMKTDHRIFVIKFVNYVLSNYTVQIDLFLEGTIYILLQQYVALFNSSSV